MARFLACDHCGRADAVMGTYYPGRDMTKRALKLCQSINGEPVTPNCYHLVVEMGEEVGIRKTTPILATDRFSPKVEGAQLRFEANSSTGTILTERDVDTDTLHTTTAPRTGVPVVQGELIPGEHPLTGQSVPSTPPSSELPEGVTEAEKAKGIINPEGSNQRPLVDPASPEGQALADAAAEEQSRLIATPVGSLAAAQGGGEDFPAPEQFQDEPLTPTPQPVSPDDMIRAGGPAPGPVVATDPQLAPATPAVKTPAQIAAEAQAKVDAEEAAKAKKVAAKKAPAKKAASASVAE